MVRICLPMQEIKEMQVQSLVGEETVKKEITSLSRILAWKTPWAEEPGGL